MKDKYCLTRREILGLLGSAVIVGAGLKIIKEKIKDFVTKPKPNTFIAGIDFEAYRDERIKMPNGDYKEISIGSFTSTSAYSIAELAQKTYSNLISVIPYYPDIIDKNPDTPLDKNPKEEYKFELLKSGDEVIKNVLSNSDIKDKKWALFRIKNFPEYELLFKNFSSYSFLENLVSNVSRVSELIFANNAIIELEARLVGETPEQISNLFKIAKEVYPKIVRAISITDHSDASGELWYPKVIEDYSKNAEIVIINNYLSDESGLKENILNLKKKLNIGNRPRKKIFARILTGEFRKNYGFMGDEKELESMLKVAYENADGCIACDLNGAWLFSGEKNPLDTGRRRAAVSRSYFKFLGYKLQKNNNPTIPQMMDGPGM
ncbi:hypothetical protein HYX19_01730 [Candidatus Woesearchaeota archaeon]|nr:hypothetical protein [Candidatus Woesearchaeota archaeon]